MGGSASGILHGLGHFSVQRATSISDKDRQNLLGSFHRDRRVKFHVLFTTVTDEDELGLGEAIEDIYHSLTFPSRRGRKKAVKQRASCVRAQFDGSYAKNSIRVSGQQPMRRSVEPDGSLASGKNSLRMGRISNGPLD